MTGRLKECRRLSTRCEKTTEHDLVMIKIAAIRQMLKALSSTEPGLRRKCESSAEGKRVVAIRNTIDSLLIGPVTVCLSNPVLVRRRQFIPRHGDFLSGLCGR